MRTFSFAFFCLLLALPSRVFSQCVPCGTITTITVDLSNNPDSVWTGTSTRNGLCCGQTGTRCIRFNVTVHPQANQIGFNVANPAPPGGAFYQLNCGPETSLGTPLCVTGLQTFCIVFCKSGGDSPNYTISSGRTVIASPDITLSAGCIGELSVEGLSGPSIQWTSVAPGAPGTYNSYLSCTSGCATTTVTAGASPPPFVDFRVSGSVVGCGSGTAVDTVRVTFVPGVEVSITPADPAVCFGSATATLTASASGGTEPYDYEWYDALDQLVVSGAVFQATPGTYTVAVADATPNCPGNSASVTVVEHPSGITADAGPDQQVCASTPEVTLSGSIEVATGGIWSGGAGTFTPGSESLSATYTPSAAEVANGSVVLTLTTTGNGGCSPAADQITITFLPQPVVVAGADQSGCAGDLFLLDGTISGGGSTGVWSTSGDGQFSPAADDLQASYQPGPNDQTAGSVVLTLSSTDGCAVVSDDLTLTLLPPPIVAAGTDMVICSEAPGAPLNGSVSGGGTAGEWTTSGSGTFLPDAQTLDATYEPGSADIDAGFVELTLTATDGCAAVSDNLLLEIETPAVVIAGTDLGICADGEVVLSGSVSGATVTGSWSSNGSGTFLPNASTQNATYAPSPDDITAGEVVLTLTSTGSATCSEQSSSITVTIQPLPVVDADGDATVCADGTANLVGTITAGVSAGVWSSSGSGTFSPGPTSLVATYTPGADDIAAGSATLTLTATDGCAATSDALVLTIEALPVVNAGADATICAGSSAVLNGSVTAGGSTGIWSTDGSGSFSPSATDLAASYAPGSDDIAAGSVTLTLTSTDGCSVISDVLTLSITALPVVDAGMDQNLCASGQAALAGSVTVDGSAGVWSSDGDGTFSPTASDLAASYQPGTADIAAGTVTLTLTSTEGCAAVSDDLVLTIIPLPIVDAGASAAVCGTDPVALAGSISAGGTTGIWSSNGTGTFAPAPDVLDAEYTPGAGDVTAGSVVLTLTSTDGCDVVTDALTLTIATPPTADAGGDATICATGTLQLNGTLGGGAVSGIWSTSGSGAFTPNNTALNATYAPSVADTTAGTVTLTWTAIGDAACANASDAMQVVYTPAPVVSAGDNSTLCANNAVVQLAGEIGAGASSGIWSTSGSGTFAPAPTALDAVYTASATDVGNGTVTLTLTTSDHGSCVAVSSSLVVTFGPAPTVVAGADQSLCANNASASLDGTVTGGSSTGLWSTNGDGSFEPDAASLSATYLPGPGDLAAGSVILELTSTDNGNCLAESDQLMLTFLPEPVVDAGGDVNYCANASVPLAGSVSGGATTGVWSTSGTGTFDPSADVLSVAYQPSAADTTNGSVLLTLTSTDQGNCNAVSDDLLITFTPAPIVDPGPDQVLCGNNADVTLAGAVSGGSTTGIWSSSGSGTFLPSPEALDGTYTPSTADIDAGSVTLTLTSTDNGTCVPVETTVLISFIDPPQAIAGNDQFVCIGDVAPLNGIILLGSGTGVWTTNGSGTFLPSADVLDAVYEPSADDLNDGTVVLTLTSTNNGDCLAVSDAITITFTAPPSVIAGSDQEICSNATVLLQGSVSGSGSTGIWSTDGDGTFLPTPTALDATYVPGAADIANGVVQLTLAATDACPVTASLTVTIIPGPTASAGPDQIICLGTTTVDLNGAVGGIATGGLWNSSGAGSFTPDASGLDASYVIAPEDEGAGSVFLVLSTTDNGVCPAAVDTLLITITQPATVDAGGPYTGCANAPLDLDGTILAGQGPVQWSTNGDGSFVPDESALQAQYLFGPADIAAGSITLTLEAPSSCLPAISTAEVTILLPPTVSAGGDIQLCQGGTAPLEGTVSGITDQGSWTTLGDGTFGSDPDQLQNTYTPGPGDAQNGSILLVLGSAPAPCLLVTDTLVIELVEPAQVFAGGTGNFVCNSAEVSLNGTVSGGTNTGTWSSIGEGTFSPTADALDAVYTATEEELLMGWTWLILTSTNNGPCAAVSDTTVIGFGTSPIVSAGPDQSICGDGSPVTLNGSVEGSSSTGIWSTSGDGVFTPSPTDLEADYIPGPGDIASGTVELALLSTNNGNCAPTLDVLVLTIQQQVALDAGADQFICNDNVAQLAGTSSNGMGTWSTLGDGTFAPDPDDLQAVYTAGPQDLDNGQVVLVLTSTGGDLCPTVTDTLVVGFGTTAEVVAGADVTICEDAGGVPLSGTVSGPTITGIWSTSGDGTFEPDAQDLEATYVPGPGDLSAGGATLTLTSTNNGNCAPTLDVLVLTIQQQVALDAGADQFICNDNVAQLAGTSSNGLGTWSTLGDGTFAPDPDALQAVYTAGPQDLDNGQVVLVLTSTDGGLCPTVTDSLVVGFGTSAVVVAGADLEVCEDAGGVPLSGMVSGPTITGMWSTSGDGTFLPDAQDLEATYVPGPGDLSAGGATLTLTSTNNGNCAPAADDLQLTLLPVAQAEAGPDVLACPGDIVQLSGSISGTATGGLWSTSGTGTFLPDASTLVATYAPGPEDLLAGTVTLYLTTTGDGACGAASDSLVVTFGEDPIAVAGEDGSTCASEGYALEGSGNGTFLWSTSGTGTFEPGADSANATYVPGAGDEGTMVTITLLVTNGCGQASDQLLLSVVPAPTLAPIHAVECGSTAVTFNAQAEGATTITWQMSDGTTLSGNNVVHDFGSTGGVSAVVTATNDLGCSVTESIQATIPVVPVASFEAAPTTATTGQPVSFWETSSGAVQWDWDLGDGNGAEGPEVVHAFAQAGEYTVVLYATSADGCTDSTSVVIQVTTGTSTGVEQAAIPSGFSPNGDGANDVFRVRGGPFSEYELRIFNNWGVQLFQSDRQQNGWDGTWKDKDQPVGTYVYTFKGILVDGTAVDLAGDVTLIR